MVFKTMEAATHLVGACIGGDRDVHAVIDGLP